MNTELRTGKECSMRRGRISQEVKEVKEEVLRRVRSGESVKKISEDTGIPKPTIYCLIRADSQGSTGQLLELNKVKRENEALLKLVGKLVLETEAKKNIKLA